MVFFIGIKHLEKTGLDKNTGLLISSILVGLLAYHIHGLVSLSPRMIASRATAYTLVAFLLILIDQTPSKQVSRNYNIIIATCLILSLCWLVPYTSSQFRYSHSLVDQPQPEKPLNITNQQHSIESLYLNAFTAANHQNPKKLLQLAKKIDAYFPHFKKNDYLLSYGHLLNKDVGLAKFKANSFQDRNRYQVETGVLLSGIAIIEDNKHEFNKQFEIAFTSLGCQKGVIYCELSEVKVITGKMKNPINIIATKHKATIIIDHQFYPLIYNEALYGPSFDPSQLKESALKYAKILGQSSYFKPLGTPNKRLTPADHLKIKKYL